MKEDNLSTRRWIWGVIAALALIEPVLHIWIIAAPPEGARATGLHTLDTYAFVGAMRHYHDDFYSPYTRCGSPFGEHHHSFYSLPHHHLYGLLGYPARWLGISPFIFLGFAHGCGVAFLLIAAWKFLQRAVPRLAHTAFLLFALGGGAGGVLYIVSGLAGAHGSATFPEWFGRFQAYELCEGPRFQPWLLLGRLYYTLPLGIGLLSLHVLLGAAQRSRVSEDQRFLETFRGYAGAACLLGACTFLNFRVGPMVWTAAVLYLLTRPDTTWRQKAMPLFLSSLGMVCGAAPALAMLRTNPELSAGAFYALDGVMWLLPFLSATLPCWLVLPGALVRGINGLRGWMRAAGFAALGYATAYMMFYVAYQMYYGNWWSGGDTSAAIAVSDWALLGGVFGGGLGLYGRKGAVRPEEATLGWFSLWFLVFFGASMCALRQGWFLQFMPQRFMAILGLPLAVMTAQGIDHLERSRPRSAAALTRTIVGCGVCSILVTWTVFYGPLGFRTAQQQFPLTRYAFMTEADGRVLDHVDHGVVLAPSISHPLFGDVVVQRPGIKTVYGNGTLDFTHEIMHELRFAVADFFASGTAESTRRELIAAWCVDYVFCPDTDPVPPEVVRELEALSWLVRVDRVGRAVLFKVMLNDTGPKRSALLRSPDDLPALERPSRR